MGRRIGEVLTTFTVSGVPSFAATAIVLVGAGSKLMSKGATDGEEGEDDGKTGHYAEDGEVLDEKTG